MNIQQTTLKEAIALSTSIKEKRAKIRFNQYKLAMW
jgi:hypothetical protein